MAEPTFTYQGHRFLWGYSADRTLCGLWEIDDPTGSPLRTWPMSEHEHAWQVFRSTEPRAVAYVAPSPAASAAATAPPTPTAGSASGDVGTKKSPGARRRGRVGIVPLLSAAGVVVAGVEIALVVSGQSAGPGLPPGQTLTSFESTVKTDLGVKGITSAACDLPQSWKAGHTFTCKMYGANGREIGEVLGTVVNTQRGYAWNANLRWQPTPP
ncbi:MAG: hypothetical protein ACRDV4_00910 [Acidimicrobiales bacterium]